MGSIWGNPIWAIPYGTHVETGCTPHLGPIYACLLGVSNRLPATPSPFFQQCRIFLLCVTTVFNIRRKYLFKCFFFMPPFLFTFFCKHVFFFLFLFPFFVGPFCMWRRTEHSLVACATINTFHKLLKSFNYMFAKQVTLL